ncbi:MAG: hypothetical protein LBJ00_17645 [Planctomycetaceae bacterium]|jgi:hypothetical protein|nr:hypothetical protein [Planctomycetaceae bacterium]
MKDVEEGFHYIVAQNNGDNTNPELFLRLRGQKGRVIFECGVWQNPNNYEVGVDLDANQIGKELFIVGIYDKTVKSWILMINGVVVATAPNDNGPVAIDAGWMIGKHDFPGKERYFIGEIYFAAVYNKALSVMLLADEDNNGYIRSPILNPEHAVLEYGMGTSNEKRLTYFSPSKHPNTNVPDDYKQVPLRTVYALSDDLKYRFVIVENDPDTHTVTVKQKSNQQEAPRVWTNVSGGTTPLLKTTYASNTKLFTDPYIVETLTGNDVAMGIVTVKLEIGKQNGSVVDVVASDSVQFVVQEALTNANGQYNWIVPGRWKIETDGITTIVPVAGAVAPKSEGSGYSDTVKRGYTFSANTYESGFKLTLKYSFTRNGVNGYLQPDRDGNEKIDSSDQRKLSFVGNSGIKLGSFTGAKEIAIFDTQAMVDRVSIIDGSSTVTGITAFQHRPANETDDNPNIYKGVPNSSVNKVRFTSEFTTNEGNMEKLTQLLNGIRYDGNLNNFYDYKNADGNVDTWQKLYNTLANNYTRWQGTTDKELEIYWKPDVVGQQQGTLEVYAKIIGQWLKYYDESGVEISNGGSLDGRIYIQTHWGSGVKFKEISIGQWSSPPSPPTN